MTRRSDSLPHPRATALFAKTIYRELKRAGYQRADVVRFLADLVDQLKDATATESERDPGLVSVLDPETGLPNPRAAYEIIDFELGRLIESKASGLLVVALDVMIPDSSPDDVASRVHVETALTLRRQLRSDDTVLRLSPSRYLAILPNAGVSLTGALVARLTRSLHHGRRDDAEVFLPRGVRYAVRMLAWDASIKDAAGLVDACLRQPPLPLVDDAAPAVDEAPGSRREVGSRGSFPYLPPRPSQLARDAGTPSARHGVVLALGGGAGRALAHVGAIRTLTEMGVEIFGIAGTSAGALVGAMHLSGMTADEIIERFEQFASSACYKHIRRLYASYLRRARRTRRSLPYFRQSGWSTLSDADIAAVPDDVYSEFIEFFVGSDIDIATLSRPFAATATDLVDGRPCMFNRGPLHVALRASCALPGLFAPQLESGRLFVDGAIVADVPVKAALDLRIDAKVLALYLARPSHRVTAFASSSEVVTRASSLIHTELVREQLRHAPILVTADVAEVGWLDFRRARATAELGAAAMRERRDEILSASER